MRAARLRRDVSSANGALREGMMMMMGGRKKGGNLGNLGKGKKGSRVEEPIVLD